MKEYYTRIIANIRVQCKKEKHQNNKGVLQLSKRTILRRERWSVWNML